MPSCSIQARDQTQISYIQADSLLSEPPGKPKNTGVGGLSLLQVIFLTQSPVLMFTFNKQPSGSAPLRQASLLAQLVKNPPAMWETWVRSLDWKDTLEKGKAIHSGILAWRIPWII